MDALTLPALEAAGFLLHRERQRRRAARFAQFIPIVVEYCDWEAVEWLKRFNPRPRDGRPVGINSKAAKLRLMRELTLMSVHASRVSSRIR